MKSKSKAGVKSTGVEISRDEFLGTIFEQRTDAAEHVNLGCRKPGTKHWVYRAWEAGAEPPSPICYYSPVTVTKPDRAKHLSAKAEYRRRCYAIVLDDVGTKINIEDIKLQPSYILESSPGNFQYGYILNAPVDIAEANAIVRGLIDAGLTDKGRTNFAAHVMRVPGSLNDKYDVPFHAKLTHWTPERRFNTAELETGLGFHRRDLDATSGEVKLPPGMSDPIFDWLQSRGMVHGSANAAGWYPVTCPWEHEHTTGNLGVDYKPGAPGAFKCLHAHGAEKTTRVFVDWVQAQFPGARDILKQPVRKLRERIVTVEGHIDGPQLTDIPAFAIDMSKSKLFNDPTGEAKEAHYDAVFAKRESKKKAAAFLENDLVHVNSEGAYYSKSVGGFIQYRSLDATFAPLINATGILDYIDDKGKERRWPMMKWLAHNERVLSVARSVSRPGEPDIIGDAVNIARPFPLHEIPEEVLKDGIKAIKPFTDLLAHVVRNKEQENHLLDWFACVTSTVEKPGHAVVISSKVHGIGKNLISGTIGMIVGPDYTTTVSQTVLQSSFNPYDCARFVVLNETRTTSRGSATLHDIEGKMKVSLSNDGESITINDKNSKHYAAKNISAWYCTSNETVPFALDKHDRRFFVIASEAEKLTTERAVEFIAWRKNGGVALLAGYLRHRWESMSSADRNRVFGAAPMTKAKEDLIELGDNSLAGAIAQAVSGDAPVFWPEVMSFEDMMLSVRDLFGRFGLFPSSAISSFNTKKLLVALKEYGATQLDRVRLDETGSRKMLWCLAHSPERIRYWKGLNLAALKTRWLRIKDARPGDDIKKLLAGEVAATPAEVFKIHFEKKDDKKLNPKAADRGPPGKGGPFNETAGARIKRKRKPKN